MSDRVRESHGDGRFELLVGTWDSRCLWSHVWIFPAKKDRSRSSVTKAGSRTPARKVKSCHRMAVPSSVCFLQSVNVHVCMEQFLKGHPNRQHLYEGFSWLGVCKIRAQFVHFIFLKKSGHDLCLIETLQEKKLGQQKSCLLPRLSILRNKLFALGNRTFYLAKCICPPCHWNMRDLSDTLKGISSNLLKSLAHCPSQTPAIIPDENFSFSIPTILCQVSLCFFFFLNNIIRYHLSCHGRS